MTILNNYSKVFKNYLLYEVRHSQLLPTPNSEVKKLFIFWHFFYSNSFSENKKEGIFNLWISVRFPKNKNKQERAFNTWKHIKNWMTAFTQIPHDCCASCGIMTMTSPSMTTLSLTAQDTEIKAKDILIFLTSTSATTSSPM